ncbi:MAG TPA: GreA/GreB family elongation factor [Kofleriaceae bacterium]
MKPRSKTDLRAELVQQLTDMLTTARTAHASAVEGATHSEAKSENDKDTRGLEQSYIARGQAQRVADLEQAVADVEKMNVEPVAAGQPAIMGALVTIDDDGETRRYFLAPHGGGNVLAGGVHVVTLSSPVGKALFGKRAGDDVELKLGGKARELVVERVE